MVWCVVCVMSSFEPPLLVFIGGNHQPLARESSQTAMEHQPHTAKHHLRVGGAHGPPGLGRATLRSADRGLSPFGPVLGLKAARWALMSHIWVWACLQSVWVLWRARKSSWTRLIHQEDFTSDR